MRGSPLLRALIAFFLIGLTGWPLARLTRHANAAPLITPPASEPAAKAVQMALTLTQPAKRVGVWHLGREIWSTAQVETEIEHELTLPWPEEGVDLRFVIEWPADAPLAAARVHITTADDRELEQSIWSRGPADAVLTFR